MIRFHFDGINNMVDSESHPIKNLTKKKYTGETDGDLDQCVDIVNFTIDNSTTGTTPNIRVRDGYTEILTGTVTSAWSNGSVAYCVSEGYLNTFDGTELTPTEIALDPDVVYTEVNDAVAFTDGTVFGLIDALGTITIVSDSTQWTDLEEAPQWESAANNNTWYEAHEPDIVGDVQIIDGGTF
jgi:hypothetical protein